MENSEKVDPKRRNLLINLFPYQNLPRKMGELADVEATFEVGVLSRDPVSFWSVFLSRDFFKILGNNIPLFMHYI